MSLFIRFTKSLFISIMLINVVAAAETASSAFPRGCEVSGFSYKDSHLILNDSGEQSYYLIQNHSDTKIEIERNQSTEEFMNPPLHVELDSMNWSAFASDVKDLNFKCLKQANENTTASIDCHDVLDICRYPRVKFALSNMGNYWISANKPQSEVIQDSVAKGIYLKW